MSYPTLSYLRYSDKLAQSFSGWFSFFYFNIWLPYLLIFIKIVVFLLWLGLWAFIKLFLLLLRLALRIGQPHHLTGVAFHDLWRKLWAVYHFLLYILPNFFLLLPTTVFQLFSLVNRPSGCYRELCTGYAPIILISKMESFQFFITFTILPFRTLCDAISAG